MVASPIADELSALEEARSRLEATLAGDENWRALTRPGRDDDPAEVRAARQVRNTRLEMALAGNALYQAWKHVNGAIDALRAQSAVQGRAADPVVLPASAGKATGGSVGPRDDAAALVRDGAPNVMPKAALQGGEENPTTHPADPSPSARAGLVERLERLGDGPRGGEAKSPRGPGVEASASAQGPAGKQERKSDSVSVDPPEATVTFVVRESRAPPPPSAPPDLGAERSAAVLDRLRKVEAAARRQDDAYPPALDAEEAEVTIISAEGLVQRRQAEERDTIVRRFRKALSGD